MNDEIDGGGMLVAPGFIDTHVHAGYQAQKRMITDVGRPDYFGKLPFLEFDVARQGATVGGDPRFWSRTMTRSSTRTTRGRCSPRSS